MLAPNPNSHPNGPKQNDTLSSTAFPSSALTTKPLSTSTKHETKACIYLTLLPQLHAVN